MAVSHPLCRSVWRSAWGQPHSWSWSEHLKPSARTWERQQTLFRRNVQAPEWLQMDSMDSRVEVDLVGLHARFVSGSVWIPSVDLKLLDSGLSSRCRCCRCLCEPHRLIHNITITQYEWDVCESKAVIYRPLVAANWMTRHCYKTTHDITWHNTLQNAFIDTSRHDPNTLLIWWIWATKRVWRHSPGTLYDACLNDTRVRKWHKSLLTRLIFSINKENRDL